MDERSRLLRVWGDDISKNFGSVLKKRGIKVYGKSVVKQAAKKGDGLLCTFASNDRDYELEADCILVANGRDPDTNGLFCEGFTLLTESSDGSGRGRARKVGTQHACKK